jgi:LacI family transcriptional regulator
MPVRLAEVARQAGVSEATASRVLSGHGYVSASSRDRVRAAALALEYVPHPAARALSRARTATVALLVHQAQYPPASGGTFPSRVVHGVTGRLRDAGHDMLYVVVDDEEVARLDRLPAVVRGRSDGVIVLGPAFPPDSIRALAGTGRPVVLIDNRLDEPELPAVMADNQPAVAALTAHLLDDHGYRRVACIAGPPGWPSTAERVAGYSAAIARYGIEPWIIHCPSTTASDGERAVARLLAGPKDPPDAIVAINDALAIGALHHLRIRAARPAVVGFDDIAWARLTDPPLTTVAVDGELMGAHAAHLILDRIALGGGGQPSVVRIPAALRVRASCGCPPAVEEFE